jgi:hypothetical protein
MFNLKKYLVVFENDLPKQQERTISDKLIEMVKFNDIVDLLNIINKQNKNGCPICGCNIVLGGYCAGCQNPVE